MTTREGWDVDRKLVYGYILKIVYVVFDLLTIYEETRNNPLTPPRWKKIQLTIR